MCFRTVGRPAGGTCVLELCCVCFRTVFYVLQDCVVDVSRLINTNV